MLIITIIMGIFTLLVAVFTLLHLKATDELENKLIAIMEQGTEEERATCARLSVTDYDRFLKYVYQITKDWG